MKEDLNRVEDGFKDEFEEKREGRGEEEEEEEVEMEMEKW